MLISTEYNYIYLSIVTEIDKFMLNLVNLSITSRAEFNNYLFFLCVCVCVSYCMEKKKKKGAEEKEVKEVGERMGRGSRRGNGEQICLCPSRVFFVLFPAEGIKQIITNSKNCVFVCRAERRNSPALKR